MVSAFQSDKGAGTQCERYAHQSGQKGPMYNRVRDVRKKHLTASRTFAAHGQDPHGQIIRPFLTAQFVKIADHDHLAFSLPLYGRLPRDRELLLGQSRA
jgi:hypothetical protein